MTGNDLTLFLIGDQEIGRRMIGSKVVGRFTFRDLQWAGIAGSGGLRLDLQFTPAQNNELAEATLVWLQAEVQSARIPNRTRGQVRLASDQSAAWPSLQIAGGQSLQWIWRLLPEDLEAIEAESPAGERMRTFRLSLRGIAQVGAEIHRVEGAETFRLPLSEWEDLLNSLGYGVPPSTAQLADLALTSHPSWAEAERRLEPARQALRAGDTHIALTTCLDRFAAVAGKPYTEASWLQKLPNDPAQKKESVARLLAAHCTYLNRVGYHRDSEHPDGTGLQPLPLDHWEAEIAVAVSQFWLAFALREIG